MPFASSQWVEQNFLPAGAIHVHAMCAHFVGLFCIRPPQAIQPRLPEVPELYSLFGCPGREKWTGADRHVNRLHRRLGAKD
jgi:hypothetical protein